MDFLTLTGLNSLVEGCIKTSLPDSYWVMAETSDVRVNHSSGHCYLEFIEKNELTGNMSAKARAYIWNATFKALKPYFEEITGRPFASGLKILVKVTIDFHPIYGYGLNIYDIDPTYTLGDMQLRKQQIINKLMEDGILEMNKELDLPVPPNRIAVITSPTAAGYEDFKEHLKNNEHGFAFYSKLFPAIMQGEQTESSILAALDRIYDHADCFDAVVIIRGGGATSDLSAFDSYLLAASCAQFPLPIITGIGHERDDSVLDIVAYHRAKTPTAAADFLIRTLAEMYSNLSSVEDSIKDLAKQVLDESGAAIRALATGLQIKSLGLIEKQSTLLELYCLKIRNGSSQLLSTCQHRLNEVESIIKLSSPQYILSKGYSITRHNGKAVKSSTQLVPGDEIETLFNEGSVVSRITTR